MARFAYVDESGDDVFKFARGSSEYFVVAIVLVDDPLPLQIAIDDLREQLHLPRLVEFTFNKTSDRFRRQFLEAVRGHSLIIRALFANKLLATCPSGISNWHNVMLRRALTDHNDLLNDTTVVLDRRAKSKHVQREISTYLRRAINTPQHPNRVREIRHEDSVRNNLLQTADMVAGAIAAHYAGGDSTWIDLIRPRIGNVTHWDGSIDP